MKKNCRNPLVSTFIITSFIVTQSAMAAPSLPTGETVKHGDVTFNRTSDNLTVDVNSQNAIIEYDTFNIGSQQSVQFNQVNTSSIALNRVTGSYSSELLGSLTCTGQCWLVNPNGIIFGPNFTADTAGLLASTLDISDQNFINGNYIFSGNGGLITNNANFTVRNGGYVALLAGAIQNYGEIYAPLGSIDLAVGNKMTVGLDALNQISVVIDEKVDVEIFDQHNNKIKSAIKNIGTLKANGGKVRLTAKVLDNIFDYAINNEGIVSAKDVVSGDGFIELVAYGDKIKNDSTGELTAGGVKVTSDGLVINKGKISAENKEDAQVDIKAKHIANIGSIEARGETSLVSLVADQTLTLVDGSTIISGRDEFSDNSIYLYSFGTAFVERGALIDASGGTRSKSAGFVEVSALKGLGFQTDRVYTKKLFFDPEMITIRNGGTHSVTANNPDGTPDEAFTDHAGIQLLLDPVALLGLNGTITELYLQAIKDIKVLNNLENLEYALIFEAGRDVLINNGVTISTLGHDVSFIADSDNDTVGRVRMWNNTWLFTNGGDFRASGAEEMKISRVDTRSATGDGDAFVQSRLGDVRVHSLVGRDVSILAGNRILERGFQDKWSDVVATRDLNLIAINGIDGDYAAPQNWTGTENGLEISVKGKLTVFNGTNRVRLNSRGSLDIDTIVSADGDVIVSANDTITARDISAENTGNKIELITTDGGNVRVDKLNTIGSIIINSDGSISELGEDAQSDLLADTLDLNAKNGIGSGNALETTASKLTATNIDNDIVIGNIGALTINGTTNTNGQTLITVFSPLTINGNVTSGGNIALIAFNDGDLSVNADVTSTNSGLIAFLAGTDFIQANGTTISSDANIGILANNDAFVNNIIGGSDVNVVSQGNTSVDHISAVNGQIKIKAGGAIIDNSDTQQDLIADTLDLNAKNGIGSGNALETTASKLTATNIDNDIVIGNIGALTINGTTNTNGQTLITAFSPLTINGNVTSGGNIALIAFNDGDLSVNADVTSTNSGLIAFLAGTDFIQSNGTTISSDANIGILANNDAFVNNIIGGSDVNVVSQGNTSVDHISAVNGQIKIKVGGAIIDNSDTQQDLVADTLDLNAQTGIGSGNALETTASNLKAANTDNSIEIANTGALSVDGSTNTNGDTIIEAASPLTVNGVVTSGGDITLISTDDGDNDDNLTINADVTSTGSGAIALLAGTNFIQTSGTTISTNGDVSIEAINDAVVTNVIAGNDAGVISGGNTTVDYIEANNQITLEGFGELNAYDADLDKDIVAPTLTFKEFLGIGVSADPLQTEATSITATNLKGDINLINCKLDATTIDLMVESGIIDFRQEAGGDLNVVNADTNAGNVNLTTSDGADIILQTDAVNASGSANIISDGNINAQGAGPHVTAGADSAFETINGTIGVEGSTPVDVNINGTLDTSIQSETGGDSGALSGSVVDPSNGNIPNVLPAVFPNEPGQNPPGDVFYNGEQIWPTLPAVTPPTPPINPLLLSQQSDSLIERFQFPTPARLNLVKINVLDVTGSRMPGQVFLYHPLGEIDSEAFEENEEFQLEEEFYEYIDGEIQRKNTMREDQ